MKIIIHTDGGSRGNPGPAAIGIVVSRDKDVIFEKSATIGNTTNNIAEYTAVLEALKHLSSQVSEKIDSVSFCLDSLLVVEQLNGNYKIKNTGLLPLYNEIQKLRSSLSYSVTFQYVPRAQNAHADALVNQALDSTLL